METTYFRLFASFTTYLLLISLKNSTFLLLLSSNVGKVAEFWTLDKGLLVTYATYSLKSGPVPTVQRPR